jgi:phosphatidylinositol alpha-1,6-mannosyltransferase
LLITAVFPPTVGGSGRWFWELYRRLPGHEVLVAAGVDPGQDEFDRTHDMRVVRLPLTIRPPGLMAPASLARYVRAVWELGRLVRSERIGRVHSGCCLPEGVMALALKAVHGTPFACYAHGEEFEYASTSRELTWLARRVLGHAAVVIANSHNTKRVLVGRWGVPEGRVRVLHPGVDTRRFVPARPDPAARGRLGWGDRPVVLTVGRLQRGKGHDVMIPAVGLIRESVHDVLYAVVGDGPERPALERMVAEMGLARHVRFHGPLDDETVIGCYQQCDLFALPNRQVGRDVEGFGIVLLEAQACGKPVLAGDAGGTVETMDVGRTGLVVPCDDPRTLAGEVVGLLRCQERRARMGEAARAWAVDRFDWDVLVRQAVPWLGVGGQAPGACLEHAPEAVGT